jgi:DNA-binding NtrC family response regulator
MPAGILIVEPDPKTARDLFGVFQSEPKRYKTEIAESVTEAIEKNRDTTFDCVILDAELPEMTGYEAISLMKTINSDPAIILTASQNNIELETKAREQNIAYYHIRSADADELKSAVHNILDKSEKAAKKRQPDKGAGKLVSLKRLGTRC